MQIDKEVIEMIQRNTRAINVVLVVQTVQTVFNLMVAAAIVYLLVKVSA